MKKDEAEKRIRDAARKGEIRFAPSDGIEAFGDEAVDRLLEVIGYSGAWVSDYSDLTDFTYDGGQLEEMFAAIETAYGIDVRPEVNLLGILRKLHAPRGSA